MDQRMTEQGGLPSREDIKRTIKHLKYTKLNEQLSVAMEGINEAHEPIKRLFSNLRTLLYGVAHEIEADYAVLLSPRQTQALDPGDSDSLTISAVYPHQTDLLPELHFTLTEADWEALTDHRGFKIYSDAKAARFHETTLHGVLPDMLGEIETAIIGVGEVDNPARFILIFSHSLEDLNRDARYRDDLQDLFALLTLWLHQIYNLTLHRLRERQYDEDRSEFIQDVMHQLTGSLSAISASVERMVSGRERDFNASLQRLYQRVHMFQSYTQTFSLAASTETRAITDVYGEEFEDFTGTDWLQLIRRNCDFFLDKARVYRIDGPRPIAESFQDLPKTSVKRQLMELVIFNLVDNAVKYSQPHADVPIMIEAHMSMNDSAIMIDFVNHGLPLSVEDTTKIFERYQRSDGAQRSEPNGTGVGLFLCRQIMRLHNGDIEVQPSRPSALYPGAHQVRFRMRLPVVAPNSSVEMSREDTLQSTLLVIEDEIYRHEDLILTLQETFNVQVLQNSEQALNYLAKPRQREQIKAILLDIRLTNNPSHNAPSGSMAGVELTHLLTHDYGYEIPIIGITSYNSGKIHREMLNAGAKKVLPRSSITLDALIEAIREYMEA